MADNIFNSVPDVPPGEPAPAVDFAEFEKVVRSRRSVRVYESEAVPEEVVRRCLDLALLAPNSSNLQPWEFHWVKSEGPRKSLVEACFGQPAASTAPVLIAVVARSGTWQRNRVLMLEELAKVGSVPASVAAYYQKLVPLSMRVGWFGSIGFFKRIAFTVIGLFRPVPRGQFTPGDVRRWAEKSTALACENLMLAFRAAGYDSCPMEGFDEHRVRRLLALPRDASVVMVISAGRRTPKGVYGPQVRFPREMFVKER